MTFKTITATLLLVLLITLNMACKNDDDGNVNLAACCEQAPLITEFDGAKVYIPNAFTPNGDGINDFFYILGGDNLEKVNAFKIYDESSNIVFEANEFSPNEPQLGWDGIIAGILADDGVYTYEVSLTSTTNETAEFGGEVCLRSDKNPNGSNNLTCVDFESQCRYGLQHDGDGGLNPDLDPGELCE